MSVPDDAPQSPGTLRRRLVRGLQIGVGVLVMFQLSECVGPKYETRRDRFQDRLTLSDGRTVQVEMDVEWRGSTDVFEDQEWVEQRSVLKIRDIDGNPLVAPWMSRRTILPMLLDYDESVGGWTVVARTGGGCMGWLEVGLPSLPYAAFKLQGDRWVRTPLPAALHGRLANIRVTGKKKWVIRLQRALLLRSPILKEIVKELNSEPARWNSAFGWSGGIDGRNASCQEFRPGGVVFY